MLLERYEYKVDPDLHQYNFLSQGPNGKIRKRIVYQFFGTFNGEDHYNLAFGDYNEEIDCVDDLSISNNQDRDKILATVASTVVDFTNYMPGSHIVAEGSTPSRTRLYQMAIAKHHHEIDRIFEIRGLSETGGWTHFNAGKNYLAFLITRK